MFCTHCGSQIDENMKFCTNCGQPVELNSEATAQDDSVNQNSSQGEWNSASDMQQDNAQQTYQQQQTYQTYQQPDAQKPNTDQYKLFLQILRSHTVLSTNRLLWGYKQEFRPLRKQAVCMR